MRPFRAKDGRLIIPRTHESSFRGQHNRSKAMTLIYLLHQQQHGHAGGLTARGIAGATGLNLDYLFSRLAFWWRIRYLSRRPIDTGKGKPAFAYAIDTRGRHFVQDRIPQGRRNDYIAELNKWRRQKAITNPEGQG